MYVRRRARAGGIGIVSLYFINIFIFIWGLFLCFVCVSFLWILKALLEWSFTGCTSIPQILSWPLRVQAFKCMLTCALSVWCRSFKGTAVWHGVRVLWTGAVRYCTIPPAFSLKWRGPWWGALLLCSATPSVSPLGSVAKECYLIYVEWMYVYDNNRAVAISIWWCRTHRTLADDDAMADVWYNLSHVALGLGDIGPSPPPFPLNHRHLVESRALVPWMPRCGTVPLPSGPLRQLSTLLCMLY